ncbi:MEMAR_RS02690 family S-layer glycoprotein [Methanoplanus endosymbiosus]|uniref:DUF3821 domain-containing protein n=1 Tax=Methanoplanus endosymbiosus TaxID=33865 RepID=A0A9E7PNU6_9EURY|nr:MEMAR_RS02690 family S-layer glycoprotein [Methanoplanus endosymbiosus]UUX93708.1 DUF3821 domain-containing protein [Methanoplanus endosymbiosus]
MTSKKIGMALIALVAVLLLAAPAMAAAYGTTITKEATVYTGESGLDISRATGGATVLGWYAAGSNPKSDAPSAVITISDLANFYVSPDVFSGKTGAWYNQSGTTIANATFYVEKPSLSVSLFDNDTLKDITNQKAITNAKVAIRVNSNLDALFDTTKRLGGGTAGIDVYVETPDGATLTGLYNGTGSVKLSPVRPDNTLYWVGTKHNAYEPVWVLDQDLYKAGTYKVYASSNVNAMKDNLGTVTGVTKSAIGTLLIDKDTVSITADKETVVRNNDFTVSVEGAPKTHYFVWISGTNSYNNETNTAPKFLPNQDSVSYLVMDNLTNTVYKGTTITVGNDVPTQPANLVQFWSVDAETGSDGKITIGLTTDGNTKDAVYTIRAQKVTGYNTLNSQLYDTVKVKVEKGSVTITASGDGSYYLGEEVTLSGTNTDTNDVYMFITGPNLPSNGGSLLAPQTAIHTVGAANNETHETVKTDDTWSYKWDTSNIPLDAGTYTIYVVSGNVDKSGLTTVKYDTVSIVIKKPFVTATTSASTVAKGDKLYIRGTAEGNPTQGVGIWVLGKNYWNGADKTNIPTSAMVTETVNDDGSFEYEMGTGITQNLAAGQYFVVVQHPMYNGVFDVDTVANSNPVEVANTVGAVTNNQFYIWGDGKLQGSDAAEALIDAINSPDIDDTYYKLTFLVEEPWIRINSIGDHYVGDQFTLTGTTNLAVGDDIIVEVTSSSFAPTQKTQSGEFSGVSSTIQVVEGTTYNEWSMDVDASTFKPDEYIVKAEAIEADATATTTFNVLKGTTPTTAPTTAPTTGPTTAPTVAPTEQPTPKPTASPGFGALIALIGLGAVAALVLRKD